VPHDLPPWSAVYYYFRLWRDDGTDQVIHDLLRCQVRKKAGRTDVAESGQILTLQRLWGSVRGAVRKDGPYRDHLVTAVNLTYDKRRLGHAEKQLVAARI
jgi:transposase